MSGWQFKAGNPAYDRYIHSSAWREKADERLALDGGKCCVCGYINTFRTSILARWHCPDNYIPGIYAGGDMYDYACCVAPRKLMMQAGKKDKLFTVDGSGKAVGEIKKIYAAAGAEQNFHPVIFNGKHEVEITNALLFFSDNM